MSKYDTMLMDDALKIQKDHLITWSKVLNADTYQALVDEMRKRNEAGYDSPYDVFRGQTIDTWIQNYAIRLP